jgi:hypothetical protein
MFVEDISSSHVWQCWITDFRAVKLWVAECWRGPLGGNFSREGKGVKMSQTRVRNIN